MSANGQSERNSNKYRDAAKPDPDGNRESDRDCVFDCGNKRSRNDSAWRQCLPLIAKVVCEITAANRIMLYVQLAHW
jgi:hypothetical protein